VSAIARGAHSRGGRWPNPAPIECSIVALLASHHSPNDLSGVEQRLGRKMRIALRCERLQRSCAADRAIARQEDLHDDECVATECPASCRVVSSGAKGTPKDCQGYARRRAQHHEEPQPVSDGQVTTRRRQEFSGLLARKAICWRRSRRSCDGTRVNMRLRLPQAVIAAKDLTRSPHARVVHSEAAVSQVTGQVTARALPFLTFSRLRAELAPYN
jgi:hypothetical protein